VILFIVVAFIGQLVKELFTPDPLRESLWFISILIGRPRKTDRWTIFKVISRLSSQVSGKLLSSDCDFQGFKWIASFLASYQDASQDALKIFHPLWVNAFDRIHKPS
jgi:hypothetical protein